MDYPKILLITEEPLSHNSLGFGRTLANLFENYPTDRILYYVSFLGDRKKNLSYEKFKTLTFGLRPLVVNVPRTWAVMLNKILFFINYSYQFFRPLGRQVSILQAFNPDVIFLAPMQYQVLLEGYIVNKKLKKPLYIYLMDDTMKDTGFHCGGYKENIIEETITTSKGWIMISTALKETLEKRYGYKSRRCLILHNPINISNVISNLSFHIKEVFKIGYAGSLHDFHLDSLITIAKAVKQVQNEGVKIQLHIFTRADFWESSRSELEKYDVIYEGFIAYDQLFYTLNKMDVLLCTTSFSRKHYDLVSTSVFTKLTDYMASGKPVWCYGPEYAANNRFMISNNLGYNTNSIDIEEVKSFLTYLLQNPKERQEVAESQTSFLVREFDVREIQKKLVSFLN